MPHILISEPAEAFLDVLGDALDRVDFGIILLNSDLRACFINRRLGQLWNIRPALLASAPTFRQLLDNAAVNGWFSVGDPDLPAYLDAREAEVRAGSIQPTLLALADKRQILFRCAACADGRRILTYTDISHELQLGANDAVARISAELRFNSEVLEDQAAHLAELAEAADENARKAESARRLLEHEVGERRKLETKLRRLATTDGLTGALNRAAFLASSQRLLEASQAAGQALVLLMLDVDHFKAINDCFGHAGGDRALEHLSAVLRSGVRQVDLFGRLGGEEFAIVLPGTSPATAEVVAERLRARVADAPVPFDDRLIPMTVSIGLAHRLDSDRSIDQVIARADQALYRAKGSGRNRVVRDQRPTAA
jgi:diguanylate cyclase (GGDEF)-like protein